MIGRERRAAAAEPARDVARRRGRDRRGGAGHRQDPTDPRTAGDRSRRRPWYWSGTPSPARWRARTRCCSTPSDANRTHRVDEAALDALADPHRSPVERLHTGLTILGGLVSARAGGHRLRGPALGRLGERGAVRAGRRPARPDRLLIGTYRPDEVTSRQPVAALLGRMERRHSVTHVRLERLSASGTAALLAAATGRPAPYRTVVALHQRTGGNPFFLEELLRGHPRRGPGRAVRAAAAVEPGRGAAAPGRGPRRGRHRVVEAAAVLGHRMPFDLLAAVTGAGEDELIRVLRDLVDQGRAGGGGRGRVQLPARAGPRGAGRTDARPAAAPAARGRPRGAARRRAASDPALVAYHAGGPAGTTTWSTRPAGAPSSTSAIGSAYPGAATGRDGPGGGRRRRRTAGRARPGRRGWPGCWTTPSGTPGGGATGRPAPPNAPTRSTC